MPPVAGGPQQLHGGQPYIPGSMAPSMQTMSQPGSPAGGQPGSASRIDPNQIPRPQSTASPLPFDTRVNGMANLPPVLCRECCIPGSCFEVSGDSGVVVVIEVNVHREECRDGYAPAA